MRESASRAIVSTMEAHRFKLAIGAVVLAAVAAGSTPAVGLRSTHAQREDTYYLYHVKFTLRYVVEWKVSQGSETEPCSSWRVDSGRSAVIVSDAPWEQRTQRGVVVRKDGIPGSIRFAATSRKTKTNPAGLWATGAAIGRAKAKLSRSWVQRGGVNWTEGCGTKPAPFAPYDDDCGQGLILTKVATFMYGSRARNDTLEDIAGSNGGNRPALVFSFQPPKQKLYERCLLPIPYELPANFAFWLGPVDIRKLKALGPGSTVPVGDIRDGDCLAGTAPEDVCTFHLELDAFITRWDEQPGSPFP